MLPEYTTDYLLDKKVKIFQPKNGYRASTDAVLLSAVVKCKKEKSRILDIGSGTGAISLCLSQRLADKNIEVHGIELQTDLVELSNYSAQQNNFNFLKFHNFDLRKKINSEVLKPCSFDIVVSNPPYSDHDMPSPNKSKATAHNLENFSLSNWLNFCLKMTKPFGFIYMVNRVEAIPEICYALNKKAGGLNILPIYSKEKQEAKRVIIFAQKDSKAPCKILSPFVVHNENGDYTENAQKILRLGLSFQDI